MTTALLQGDCLELMQTIEGKSIDMILCDLPYGTTNCKWDVIIPFEPLWEQYSRIIKDNGAIVLFGSEPFSTLLRSSNLKMFKYDWIWKKPLGRGFLNAKKQPLRDVEVISVFYKKQCKYNPQYTPGKPYSLKGSKQTGLCSRTTVYGKFFSDNEHTSTNNGFRYPKQVLEFGVVGRGALHPTQKPVALLKYLIKTYTNEGDTVLDNCMGSGSTGVACKILSRNFVGIESNKEYFEIAKRRINSTGTLF